MAMFDRGTERELGGDLFTALGAFILAGAATGAAVGR